MNSAEQITQPPRLGVTCVVGDYTLMLSGLTTGLISAWNEHYIAGTASFGAAFAGGLIAEVASARLDEYDEAIELDS